ncbi:MAG: ABC transporter ATP-binding protein [Cephaloticoccus sp.]|nr:ABC transporter ATP-binding protein [Cephaloticoccus sp.]MCF7760769.1 ABC transporter ATP-binding protein [Cephaloticoccus sp.]
MNNATVISAQGISKAYRIWNTPSARLTSPLMEGAANLIPSTGQWLRKKAHAQYRDFWAIKEVSFEVKKGESLGIIGRNGSGKSTLLQIIAGTLQATSGSSRVEGRVAALLELGSGFNPDFTGRENVYLNAAVLGLSRREVDQRYDQIAAFADIGDFIEQPVKTYSSGMFVRLAFAVQTAVEPQVLIIDEALSVGDVFFQQRCYERMRELLDKGVCVVLASHDLGSVQQFCKQTLVFRRGEVAFHGPSTEATKVYFQLEQQDKVATFATQSTAVTEAPATPLTGNASIPDWPTPENEISTSGCRVVGNGWARCSFLAVCNTAGEACLHFRQGQKMSIFYEFEILHDMEFCVGCVTIRDKTGQAVHSKITLQDGVKGPARVKKGSRMRFRQDTELNISCEDYTLDISLDMISADLLLQPGISYDDFMASQLRICELHSVTSLTVRLRENHAPFQLLHFGLSGLPSHSTVEIITPEK